MLALESSCNILLEKDLKISCAESLTGGMIAAELVRFPGISQCFEQGFVTYSNEAKHSLLGVKEETLKKHGAVSLETSREMAYYVRKIAGSDIGLSSTGIAGPTGGSDEKPVGLVYISCSIKDKVITRKFIFPGSRALIRYRSMRAAIRLLYDCLRTYCI